MSFLARLLGTQRDPREEVRPLWHKVVAISRTPDFYARCGVADTIDGRFDMIVHVLSLTMLRMEQSGDLGLMTARLTELFVEDMDGQLRENGVGDVVVGKHIGRLMSALGGRMAALRKVLGQDFASRDAVAMAEVLERNVHWSENADAPALAVSLLALADQLAACSDAEVLAGDFGQ